MYTYSLYIDKKMVFSSSDITKIYTKIHKMYDKQKLETFNIEYFGNNYVTKYSKQDKELYIIQEKTGFIKDNITKLRKPKLKLQKYIKLEEIKNHDDMKNLSPISNPANYEINTIRIGNDNRLYIVEESNSIKKWKLK